MNTEHTPDNKTLRIFSSLLSAVASGWLMFYLYHNAASMITHSIAIVIAVFFITGLVCPQRLQGFYRRWVAGAEKLNQWVINTLLAVIFFFIITPTALLRRSLGKDALKKPSHMNNSYRQKSRALEPQEMEQPY